MSGGCWGRLGAAGSHNAKAENQRGVEGAEMGADCSWKGSDSEARPMWNVGLGEVSLGCWVL